MYFKDPHYKIMFIDIDAKKKDQNILSELIKNIKIYQIKKDKIYHLLRLIFTNMHMENI